MYPHNSHVPKYHLPNRTHHIYCTKNKQLVLENIQNDGRSEHKLFLFKVINLLLINLYYQSCYCQRSLGRKLQVFSHPNFDKGSIMMRGIYRILELAYTSSHMDSIEHQTFLERPQKLILHYYAEKRKCSYQQIHYKLILKA